MEFPICVATGAPATGTRSLQQSGLRGTPTLAALPVRSPAIREVWHRIQGILAGVRYSDLRLVLIHFKMKLIIWDCDQLVAHTEKAPNRDNGDDDLAAVFRDQIVNAADLLVLVVIYRRAD